MNPNCVRCGSEILDPSVRLCPTCGEEWATAAGANAQAGQVVVNTAGGAPVVVAAQPTHPWVSRARTALAIIALMIVSVVGTMWVTQGWHLDKTDQGWVLNTGKPQETGTLWEAQGTVENTTVEYRYSAAVDLFECRTMSSAPWQSYKLSDVLFTRDQHPDVTVCGVSISVR